jgi:hypothetical protein
VSELPRPAPIRAVHTYTKGEIAALVAPLFGVEPGGLGYAILIQTPDGHCDARSNIATAAETRDFLQEAIDMMPGGES